MIHKGEYGDSLIAGPAARPEPPTTLEDRHIEQIALLKALKITPAQLATATLLGFPQGHPRAGWVRGSWVITATIWYKRSLVNTWLDQLRAVGHVAKLRL